jgi:hypothetical protein
MTATEFESAFDLICDKVGSPYFSQAEKESFINRAQISTIDDMLFPKRRKQERKDADVYGFDNQSSSMQGLQPLIVYSEVVKATNTTALISALEATSSESVYRVMNVILPDDIVDVGTPQYPARYVPSIKTSSGVYGGLRYGSPTTVKTGIYSIEGATIAFLPAVAITNVIGVEFIKVPASFDISGSVTCEVDPSWHNEILFRALQLAGISIREDFFYQAMNLEQQKEQ